ncbi:MAG: translation initiation factor IF-2 [Candidatus Diapherotrites archaeon]
MLRKPIVTVLGHVDHGKTKYLDAIRGTSVTEKEAGGITQHIGATEVPTSIINSITKSIAEKFNFQIKIPGLLFIDTPGHEAFVSLRQRGSSLADIAILVIDINVGMQEQTNEAIEILKNYKCPFIVAANKIDTIKGWNIKEGTFIENEKEQRQEVLQELDQRIYTIVGQLYEKGFSAERFDRVKDFTKEITIIPISAKFKIGIAETLLFLAALSQKYLEKKLDIKNEKCLASVLEVKEEKGLGKTLDIIIYEGSLSIGDEIILGRKNGIIKTKIRALLEPKQFSSKGNEKYVSIKKVHAAAGVKIAAPNLDEALAGSPLRLAGESNEKEIMEEINKARFESDSIGPIVRSNTLGSLEALVKILETKGIKVKKADVGDIQRSDVIEAQAVMEKDKFKGVIFAFHTKVSPQAEQEAQKRSIKIFKNDVVYRIIEDYEKWVIEEKEAEKRKKLAEITYPAKIKVLEGFVFRRSEPVIVGIKVLEGKLKKGVSLMKKNKVIGKVLALQSENKNIEEATKDMEIAISIEEAVLDKDFSEGDELYTFIPKSHFSKIESIIDSFSREELALIEEIRALQADIEKEEEK